MERSEDERSTAERGEREDHAAEHHDETEHTHGDAQEARVEADGHADDEGAETGQHEEGLRWLDEWIRTCGRGRTGRVSYPQVAASPISA